MSGNMARVSGIRTSQWLGIVDLLFFSNLSKNFFLFFIGWQVFLNTVTSYKVVSAGDKHARES